MTLRLPYMAALVLLMSGCYRGSDDDAGADGDGGSAGSGDVGDDDDDDDDDADDDDDDDGPAELECEDIGRQPLRRISHVQYEQILRDVLPSGFRQAALEVAVFPETHLDSGFSTFATANTVNTGESIMMEDNAEAIAQVFFDGRAEYAPQLVPCLDEGYDESDIDACIEGFVDDFGAALFRRSLTGGERDIALGLYEGISDEDGPDAGLTGVVHWFLQAPALLYVTERGVEGDGDLVALAPQEIAVRLSLLFTNGVPDDELLAAVADGQLVTREDVEREARRLVESPEAVRAFAQFHHEWMQGFHLDTADREHELWNDEVQVALEEELMGFAAWFLEETDRSFETLMTTDEFPIDDRLADIYAQDQGPARRGLLSTAATMATHAHSDSTSLIERAAFIRDHVMCIPPPPFPEDIDIDGTLEGFGELPTARQRLEPLMTEPACSGCHAALNPLGFPFEVYDWAGVYRETENGAEIDTTAEIVLAGLQGEFADAGELIVAMAATDEAQACYATHWFRYAMGRLETMEDACALESIQEAFIAAEGDVPELLVQIAVSDAFMFKKVGS